MTQRALRKLGALRAATVRYSPRVESKLAQSGTKTDTTAIVGSAAKYYVALKKLANK
jgi:hypothetical protein